MEFASHVNRRLADLTKEEALAEQDCHAEQAQPFDVVNSFVSDRLLQHEKHREYAIHIAKNNIEAGAAVINAQFH